jgi:hypothetical protein
MHPPEDAQQEPAGVAGVLDPCLPHREHLAAVAVELRHAVDALPHVAVEAVESDHDHGADLPGARVLHEAVEDRARLRDRALLLVDDKARSPGPATQGPANR